MQERKIYTVSELNHQVRLLLEQQFENLWLAGEISNFKHYPSGHMYFSLKDQAAQTRCVMFAGHNRKLAFTPKDGQQVVLKAKVSLYEDRGDYQLLVDYMEEAGDGALKRAYELLKQTLAAEGLFSQEHKKALPTLPRCIGLVTSAKGAAIHDILTTLKRRFPALPVIIYPAQVQGLDAIDEICHAIRAANQQAAVDVLIVGRGGGSLEDLQAFNSEKVARAIFASQIPIISAVGHEVDVTIADFVADLRAATPTAAAELVSPDRQALLNLLLNSKKHLATALLTFLQQKMQEADYLGRRLKHPGQRLQDVQTQLLQLKKLLWQSWQQYLFKQQQQLQQATNCLLQTSPQQEIKTYLHQVAMLKQQLEQDLQRQIKTHQQQFMIAAAQLESLSPLKVLGRGYSILFHEQHVLNSVNTIQTGDKVEAKLLDGNLLCQVLEITKK